MQDQIIRDAAISLPSMQDHLRKLKQPALYELYEYVAKEAELPSRVRWRVGAAAMGRLWDGRWRKWVLDKTKQVDRITCSTALILAVRGRTDRFTVLAAEHSRGLDPKAEKRGACGATYKEEGAPGDLLDLEGLDLGIRQAVTHGWLLLDDEDRLDIGEMGGPPKLDAARRKKLGPKQG